MKKTLLFSLLMAGAVSAFGQGFLDWGNSFTGVGRFPIYGPDPGSPNSSVSGQSSLGLPSGTTVYGGALLQGAGFTFAIYTGTGADPNAYTTLLVSTTFRTSANPAALPAGLVNGGTIAVPGVTPGSTVNFVVKAWDNAGGTISSYDAAAIRGQSAIVTSGGLGGIGPNGPIINPSTIGWTSFNIAGTAIIPEPSTFALAGLGAAALLIFRRRK